MKVVRLPSGPLACVYSLLEDERAAEESPQSSGVFRAHSGSLHADGYTEDEALAVLDEHIRRVSIPPADDGFVPTPVPNSDPPSSWAARVRKCVTVSDLPTMRPASTRDQPTPSEGVGTLPGRRDTLKSSN
ncbi:MAG TPA: hypothetical protein VGP93_08470 [Polyangiaceae bacterium]|jgi:hypothetical protein|nr:hypothetical protein [Polyangiaceae bacterium]